jgi:hypothetical protein
MLINLRVEVTHDTVQLVTTGDSRSVLAAMTSPSPLFTRCVGHAKQKHMVTP